MEWPKNQRRRNNRKNASLLADTTGRYGIPARGSRGRSLSVNNPQTQKRMTTWLLAVLVLGGSISPPAYRHAHAGGDIAHNHHSDSDQRHLESHSHHGHGHSHSHPHRHQTDDLSAAEAPTSHLHLTILGFELTLPTSEHEDDSPDSERDKMPVIVRVLDECVLAADGADRSLDHEATRSVIVSTAVISSADSHKHTRPTVPSVLLCDAARHERSGVLRC